MADAPSRSPSPRPPVAEPSSSNNAALDDREGHRRREIVLLSPRESPTPPVDSEAAAAPIAPTLRVVAASPPPPYHDALVMADQPRSLLRQLASAGTAAAGSPPLPVQPADPAHLAPDLYYDAAGRLRTTVSNSRVRRAALSPPEPDFSPADEERAAAAAADEDDDEQALLVSSLRAGDASRTRRRFYRGRSIFADPAAARDGAEDEVVGDTGWVQLGAATAAYPEVSPEELRAAREAHIASGAAAAGVPFVSSSPSLMAAVGAAEQGGRPGAAVEQGRRTDSTARTPTELAIEALHAEREAAQRQLEASERNFAAATAQLEAHRTLGERIDSAFASSLWRVRPPLPLRASRRVVLRSTC